MDSLLANFKNNRNNEIKALYSTIMKKGNFHPFKFYSNSDFILKSSSDYIYMHIYNYIKQIIIQKLDIIKDKKEGVYDVDANINNIQDEKKEGIKKYINNNKILRNINYLKKQIILKNISSKYKLTNKDYTNNLLLLSYLIIFDFHISLNYNTEIISKNKYLIIKYLYKVLKLNSLIASKLYLDKSLDLEQLEILLKILIIFSINNSHNIEIKEDNKLENIMYLKQCLKIIKNIYKNNTSKEEQILLIDIFKFINSIICISDNKNNYINYTNKFYMINNDHKTTKLLSLMNIIHKINNEQLNEAYFNLLSNIYYFQFNYNNLNWPFYKLLEPSLVNIHKKNYSEILNEISFPEFQLNFIKYLINKERDFIKDNPCIFKNGFYFGDNNNNNNSGIVAYIGQLQDNFILTFGFKLIIKNEQINEKEFILLQFKNKNDYKTHFKISIMKKNNSYNFTIISNKNKELKLIEIPAYEYYIFSLQFKDSNLYIALTYNKEEPILFEIKKLKFKASNDCRL